MLAARIAMTSIALLWPKPRPSNTLLEQFKFSFDFDRTLGLRVTNISCESGNLSFHGTNRRMPDGLRFENCTWEELFKKKEAHFKVIGKVLEFYLDFQKQSAQPKMMKALLHALLLFHEGCLNQSPLLSTVNFAASLDALAAGQKENGILKLINAGLGKDKNDQLFSDRSTPKQVIDKIYDPAVEKGRGD